MIEVRTAVLLLCALYAAAPQIAAADASLLQPPAVKTAAHYIVEVDVTMPDGEIEQRRGKLELARAAGSDVRVRGSSTEGSDDILRGILQSDGTVAASDFPYTLATFNLVAKVLTAAPAALVAGTTWKTDVNVPIGRRLQRITVTAHAAAVSGSKVTITFDGTGTTEVDAEGSSTLAALSESGTAVAEDGALVEAHGSHRILFRGNGADVALPSQWSLSPV